jgi:hypothetical protein
MTNTPQPYRPNLGKQHTELLRAITASMNDGALSHWTDLDTLRRIIESAWRKTFPGQVPPAGTPHKERIQDLEM